MAALRISENKRYLVKDNNTPFFYLGDTAWEIAYRLNREEISEYLHDRAEKKFTVIQMMGVSEFGELNRPNVEGHLPFIDKDPARPNDAFFGYVEYILDVAETLGLFVAYLPVWGDHVGPLLWGSNPHVLTAENALIYGRYLGNRFRERQIIWIVGGDRPVETEKQRATWSALATGLREGDGGSHLMGFHPPGGNSSSKWWQDAKWLDFNMIQTGHGERNAANYEHVAQDYPKHPIKPTMEDEISYENHPVNMKPELGAFDDYDIRKGAYWSVFAGGFGFTYGCNEIFFFWDPERPYAGYDKFIPRIHWREAAQLPGACQLRYLRALIESRPFLTRIPDQSLLVSEAGEGTHHVQATRDLDGSFAFIYCPSERLVTVDLTKLSGETLKAYWYNPRNGQSELIGVTPKDGERDFIPPATHSEPDWVLVLDDTSRNFAPPGCV